MPDSPMTDPQDKARLDRIEGKLGGLDTYLPQLLESVRESNRQIRDENAAFRAEMRQDRADVRVESAAFRAEMHQDRAEMRHEMETFRTELRTDMAQLRTDMTQLRTDLFTELRADSRAARWQRAAILVALFAIVIAALL